MLVALNAGLTDFLQKLDGRYEEKVKKGGTMMAKKERKIGSPLSCKPPEGAPEWTIKVRILYMTV